MKRTHLIYAALAVSILLAILLAPWASSDPDGLEKVADDLAFQSKVESEQPAWEAAPLPDYETPGVQGSMSTAVAGVLGTVATFGAAFGVAMLLKRRTDEGESA